MSAGKGGTQSLGQMMSMLGGGSGPPGTAQQPWNPAARLAQGQGFSMQQPARMAPQAPPGPTQAQRMPFNATTFDQNGNTSTQAIPAGPAVTPPAATQPQPGFMQTVGNAIIPNTMSAINGKGGSVG